MCIRDDDFLCESCDRIDNSVFNYIEASLLGKPVEEPLKAALQSLCVDTDEDIPAELMAMEPQFASAMKEIIKWRGLSPDHNNAVPWNMGVVGDLSDFMETSLVNAGIHTCHPFENEDGCICYSCPERCDYCIRNH